MGSPTHKYVSGKRISLEQQEIDKLQAEWDLSISKAPAISAEKERKRSVFTALKARLNLSDEEIRFLKRPPR